MNTGKENLKVGLTFLVTLSILIGGYVWLTNFRLGRPRYFYKAYFTSVSWLNKGDLVMVSGVPKGRVHDIELFPDSVVVTFWVEDYPLRRGAKVWIESQGIVGEKRLGVSLGRGTPLPENAELRGETKPDLNAMIEVAYMLAKEVEGLSQEIRGLLQEFQGRLNRTEEALIEVLADLRKLAWEVQTLVRTEAGRMDSTLLGLQRLIYHADSLLAQIRAGEGTFWKIVQDTTLYGEIRHTLKQVQDLLTDIRENPERYIRLHFSLF